MFYSALVKFLERHFGILESDVIAKFSELFVPLCLSIFVTVAMYQFIQRNLRREFELARRSCLKLVYAPDKTFSPKANFRQTYLRAINESGSDIPGAQVKIVGARLRKEGSNTWGPTSVIANPNMSWGSPPDGHPNKYSAIQPPPRSEVIDFISSPWTDNSTGTKGFLIRINPQHGGTINPFFWQHGTYKFTMLLSAPNTEPDELTLRVDWDGNDFLIRSEAGQILEPHSHQ